MSVRGCLGVGVRIFSRRSSRGRLRFWPRTGEDEREDDSVVEGSVVLKRELYVRLGVEGMSDSDVHTTDAFVDTTLPLFVQNVICRVAVLTPIRMQTYIRHSRKYGSYDQASLRAPDSHGRRKPVVVVLLVHNSFAIYADLESA
jgi:hypothetical protein